MHFIVRTLMPFAQYAWLACSNVCLIPTITMLTQDCRSHMHVVQGIQLDFICRTRVRARDEKRKYNSTRFGLLDRSFRLPKRKERRGADYR